MADGIKIGSLDISAFKVGSSDCKVYLGSTLLYPQSTTQYKVILDYTGTTPTSYVNCNASSILTSGETRSNPSGLSGATIGDCVTELGEKVFYSCSKFSSVTISDNVSVIGTYAFGYTALSGVTLPSSLTTIGNNAFYYTKLESINIPSGCTSIGNSAFGSSTALTSVTVNATTPPTLGTGAFTNTNANLKIYVPCDSVAAYKAATNWSSYASKIEAIPDSCTGQTLQWVSFSAGDAVPSGNVYGIKVSGATAFPSIISGNFFFINDSNDLNVYNGARYRWYYDSNSCGTYENELGFRDDNWELMFNTVCGVDYYSVDTSKTTVIPYDCQLYIYA